MNNSKDKRICLFIDFVESTGAARNRLLLNQKGGEDNNIHTEIISIFEEKYRHNKVKKYLNAFFYIIVLFFKLFSLKQNDIVYIYGEFYLPLFINIVHFKKGIVITERTEYPSTILFNKRKSVLDKLYYQVLNKVNVFVTCSAPLVKFYSQFTNEVCRFFVIPVLVDMKLFEERGNENIITYCGYMGGNKDGVSDLIEIYSKTSIKDFLKLYLIGDAPKDDMIRLKEFVKKLKLENNVVFTGRLCHQETLRLLSKSSLHVLARPNNKQAEGGFPSKLGEYLATGKPTLVTSVGDIPKYIKDGENGFIVSAEQNSFQEKMDWIIRNPNVAKKVGQKGKVFISQYTPQKQINKLLEFL